METNPHPLQAEVTRLEALLQKRARQAFGRAAMAAISAKAMKAKLEETEAENTKLRKTLHLAFNGQNDPVLLGQAFREALEEGGDE